LGTIINEYARFDNSVGSENNPHLIDSAQKLSEVGYYLNLGQGQNGKDVLASYIFGENTLKTNADLYFKLSNDII
jgi:hypothetical protein